MSQRVRGPWPTHGASGVETRQLFSDGSAASNPHSSLCDRTIPGGIPSVALTIRSQRLHCTMGVLKMQRANKHKMPFHVAITCRSAIHAPSIFHEGKLELKGGGNTKRSLAC